MKPGKREGKAVLRTGGGASSTEFTVELMPPTQALRLFDAGSDVTLLDESRVGWAPNPLVAGDAPDTKAVGLGYAADAKWVPEDLTRSLFIGDRIAWRAAGVGEAQSLAIKIRRKSDASAVHVVLVDEDGAAWEIRLACDATWRELDVPLDQFNPTKWALLPQAFPNGMSYWSSLDGAEKLDPAKLERLQFSVRKADLGSAAAAQSGVEIQTVSLRFKGS